MVVQPVPEAPGTGAIPGAGSTSNDGRHGLFVVLEEGDGQVEPGGEWTTTVRVRNTGRIVERVDLRCEGLPPSWVTFEPQQVNLESSGELSRTAVKMRVRPPRSADTTTGWMSFSVYAWSVSEPSVRVEQRGRLVVGAFAQTSTTIDPLTSESRRGATFTIAVRNDGNAPVDASIVTDDPNNKLRFHASERTVRVAPNQVGQVQLDVVPKERLVVGAAVQHPFTVTIQSGTTPAAPVAAVLVQRPILPRWAPRVVALLAVVLVGAGAVWAKHIWDTRDREVPQVRSIAEADATAALGKSGFDVQVIRIQSMSDAGTVLSERPAGLTQAAGGSVVTITVSKGPGKTSVPELSHLPKASVEAALKQAQLVLGNVSSAPSATDPIDAVIMQDPEAHKEVPWGTKVDVTVSSGPRTVVVPPLQTLQRAEAVSALMNAKLGVQVVVQPTGGVADTVVGSNPAQGTSVAENSIVTIYVTPAASPASPTPTPG
jgi:beta-lactam-binding protein with PASTA domain